MPPNLAAEPDFMAAVSNVIELPFRHDYDDPDALELDIVFTLATADDLAAGMRRVVEWARRASNAARVEWWAMGDDDAVELVAAAGSPSGTRQNLQVEHAGVFVLHGARLEPQTASALMSLSPIIRRRAAEERLERTTIQLARRNEALEDFAALVAHELKTPLHAALVADDSSRLVEEALDLVDELLEALQNEPTKTTFTAVSESLDRAVEDLHTDVEVAADLATTLPMPPGPLRVILRNLLSNAVAAGARHVHVGAMRTPRSWQLLVDDDGVGLAEGDRYGTGSGLGLSLCRRIAARFGGVLDLAPRSSGGTRATLTIAGALP
jgi:signal transduction histidine kinase